MERVTRGEAQTGIVGLDDVLAGGLQRSRVFLLEGSPGTGKTTIALQYLLTGVEAGKAVSISPCRKPRTNCGPLQRRTNSR